MKIVKLDPAQVGEVAAFTARLQADETHQIAYFGSETVEIAAAVQSFDPANNVLLAYDDGHLIGVLGVDTDEETHRAWLYGPLVDHADWDDIADALYGEALRQDVLPLFVRDEELFVDVANTNVAAFAARHCFVPGAPGQPPFSQGRSASLARHERCHRTPPRRPQSLYGAARCAVSQYLLPGMANH